MEKTQNQQTHEKKERIPVWLYPSTLEAIDRAMRTANCKSRSEFLENAAQFYAGYISAEDAVSYLPAALTAAFRATVHDSENRIARLLFKNAVELSMMMNVLAIGMEILPEDLKKLREKCVYDVKRSNGSVSLNDVVREEKLREAGGWDI